MSNTTQEEFKREPGCTCTPFDGAGNVLYGGYARCPIHDPNMQGQETELTDFLKSKEVKTIPKSDNYIPYGPEWEKELMKYDKTFLIDMVRMASLKNKELEKQLSNSPGGAGVQWVLIDGKIKEVTQEDLAKESFDVDFDGQLMLEISNANGEWFVTNGMDGHGNNVFVKYKDFDVKILSETPLSNTPTVKDDGRDKRIKELEKENAELKLRISSPKHELDIELIKQHWESKGFPRGFCVKCKAETENILCDNCVTEELKNY